MAAGIKKCKSIIRKKKKKHDEIVLLARSILNSIEVIDSNMSQNYSLILIFVYTMFKFNNLPSVHLRGN